jgi:hypothetical protein
MAMMGLILVMEARNCKALGRYGDDNEFAVEY